MDETKVVNNQDAHASSNQSSVSVEGDDVLMSVDKPSIPAYTIFAFFAVAFFGSLVLRRLGRINAANRIRRWLPLLHVVIWSTAGVAAAFSYAASLPDYWVIVLGLFLVVMTFASVGWLRSVTAGIAIAVEARLKIGDSIRIHAIEGEITAFSLRSVRVRSVDGTVHEIPNEKFMAESVANLSGDGGDSACEVTLKIPPSIEPNRALAIARNAAILTPLASPQHQPEVFLNATDEREETYEIQVRGYAFDPSFQDHYRSDVIARFHDDFRRERALVEAGASKTAAGLVLVED